MGRGTPVLLIHGFAGSIDNCWRETIPAFEASYTVYAIDLLGLGLSAKPVDATYGIELWADQIAAFCKEVVQEPIVLFGNSFGSLVALAAAKKTEGLARGIVMMNCASGMNYKNAVRMELGSLHPFVQVIGSGLVELLNWVFGQRNLLAYGFKQFANLETVRDALKNIYVNTERVDDALAAAYLVPADDPRAVDVFGKIYTGDPGPMPQGLVQQLSPHLPMLVVWGDEDKLAPIGGPVGKFMRDIGASTDRFTFTVVNAGHVPHDDAPAVVNPIVKKWLANNIH